MSETIFVDGGDGRLQAVKAGLYSLELDLQTHLANHPELIPLRLSDGTLARWLLIKQEAGVPGQEGGSSWWSLDHLLVDQQGKPTFVEAKLSKNREIRRQVVGQMIEYAANGTAYWPEDRFRTWFEQTAKENHRDASEELERHLAGTGWDQDEFWKQVWQNLQDGVVRLVFVADTVPVELWRLVEFLNERLVDIDVLAVEIPQFTLTGVARPEITEDVAPATTAFPMKILVPRLIGQTARSEAVKSAGSVVSPNPMATDIMRRLDELKLELDIESSPSRTGRTYNPRLKETGVTYFYGLGVYHTNRGVEFNLSVFRELGRDDVAEDLLRNLADVTGLPKKPGISSPAVSCETLLRDWDRSLERVIRPYFKARADLRAAQLSDAPDPSAIAE